ncbi:MAG: murein transglycosylase domain-containing protein [Candidatus Methylomirabilis sp.]|nr:murein transglycosylase domain-containing protein [Deltaproteobacteria bacterium]
MKKKALFALAALFLLDSCTLRQAVNIAVSKDPQKALEALADSKIERYKGDPFAAVDDFKKARAEFNKMMSRLSKASGEKWGKKEVELPTKTRYVKYTQNYKSRAIVDFDSGQVVIETINDTEKTEEHLKNAVVTTLLTPSDPRSVDLFSDKQVELSGTPYMYGLVSDHRNKLIESPEDAEQYADHLVNNQLLTRMIETDSGQKELKYVKFGMVNGHIDKRALKYEPMVEKYAASANVSKSLVLAIMKTESAFNPYAISPVPAYGLMQLVPSSGGKDAYRKVKGVSREPDKEFLFVPENNIELGTAYLNMLMYEYLNKIEDPLSREYCVVAAYNTGAGNVLRTFSRNMTEAVGIINSLPPGEVYERLKKDLPYEETRNYIVKVINTRKSFSKTSTPESF